MSAVSPVRPCVTKLLDQLRALYVINTCPGLYTWRGGRMLNRNLSMTPIRLLNIFHVIDNLHLCSYFFFITLLLLNICSMFNAKGTGDLCAITMHVHVFSQLLLGANENTQVDMLFLRL